MRYILAILVLAIATPASAATFTSDDYPSSFYNPDAVQRQSPYTVRTMPLGGGLQRSTITDSQGNQSTCIMVPLGDGSYRANCH